MTSKGLVWDLVGPVCGIVFIVLIVVGAGVAGEHDVEISDSSADIARELEDKSDQVDVGSLISLVGFVFFFWFLAYFRRHLKQAEGEDGWLTSVVYGSGLVGTAMILVLISLSLATTSGDYDPDPQAAKALFALTWNYIWVIGPPLIAFTAAASIVIIRFAALPRWIGWIGILVALSSFMPWMGILFFFPWILVVSVALLIRTWWSQPEAAS